MATRLYLTLIEGCQQVDGWSTIDSSDLTLEQTADRILAALEP